MTYDSSNLALKHIGEGLGYGDPPDHYNLRCWAANEVNYRCSFPFLLHYFSFGCQSGAFMFPLSRFPTPILMFSTFIGHFTEAERKTVLGQSGNGLFEKHYQSDFIGGLQHVVLLRPSQAALCREARKSRRDPFGPTDLSDEQLEAIRRMPCVVQLVRLTFDGVKLSVPYPHT